LRVVLRADHCACADQGKNYWDMGGLTAHAPPTWLEELGKADVSWAFGATEFI
jgi:hypothetical protein